MIAADYTVLGSVRGGGVRADHGGGAPVEHLQQLLVQEAALHGIERVGSVDRDEVAHLDELILLQTAVAVLVQGLEYLLSSLLAFLLGKSLNIYKLSTIDN